MSAANASNTLSKTAKENYWYEHVNSYNADTLSGKAYCRSHNLNYSNFLYWRKKLLTSSSAPASLLPVKIKPDADTHAQYRPIAAIELASGKQLRIFDYDVLYQLLENG